jgi:hypothetical protein
MTAGFEFSRFLVDRIIYFAINNNKFLRVIRHVVDPDDLPGDSAKQILKVVYSFHDESPDKFAPGDHFLDEFDFALKRGFARKDLEKQVKLYVKDLSSVKDDDMEIVLRRLDKFVKGRTYQRSVVEMSHMASKFDLDGCRDIAVNILKAGIDNHDKGMKFFDRDSIIERGMRYEKKIDVLMPYHIEPFDLRGGGFGRKQFILIMGQEKMGKTWSGIYWGRCGVMDKLRVLHITHESGITQWKLGERYEMAFASVGATHKYRGKREEPWVHEMPILKRTAKGKVKIDFKKVERGSVRDRGKVTNALRGAMEHGGDLIIKEYPRGSCSIAQLESYLDTLETIDGFVPDIIINDYPDIMKLPPGDYRHAVNSIYEDHARIAAERNCLMIGVSQVKAKAYGKAKITLADFAEDKRKAGGCDAAFAICQTPREKKKNIVRLVWVLDRFFGCEGMQVGLLQDLHLGQFCKESYMMKDLEVGEEDDDE